MEKVGLEFRAIISGDFKAKLGRSSTEVNPFIRDFEVYSAQGPLDSRGRDLLKELEEMGLLNFYDIEAFLKMCKCPANVSTSMPSEFLLLGLSWIEDKALWLAIPLTVWYSFSCVANCTLITIIVAERNLHKTMFIYIAVLGVVDLMLSGSVIPKVLAILWFESYTISADACLMQMFLFFGIESVEVSLFMLMSYDRYAAICHPLRYPSIITNSFILKSALILFTRNMIFLSTMPYLTIWMPYCMSNIVPNSFCEHLAVIKLSCGDRTPNNIFMLALVCIHTVADCGLIGLSYLFILRVVLSLASSEARKKAFNTCSTHIIIIGFFVSACIFSFLVYMFDTNAPLYIQTTSTLLIGLVPPLLNPIAFGIRMKEIRQGLKKLTLQIHHQRL
ncbi:olfactory receptor 52K2-like [Pleurodeles waltl]|uniref:olfactory receptor 52K2-like n=1 Tax=Pleurodeles waltl TaxID=8319 RepID=UPI00370996AF